MEDTITIDEFKKLDLRVGTIVGATRVPDADKLIELSVDLGEGVPRTIVSGIATYISDTATLVGMQCTFVANMALRKLRGLESRGMLLAASTEEGTFAFLTPSVPLPPGTKLK